jgi:hypothetical protein
MAVFENRVLRRIFAPRRKKVTGGWRILLVDDIHKVYCSPNIIIIWAIKSISAK